MMAFSIDYNKYYNKFDLYLHYKWNVDDQPITSIANQVFDSVLPNINSERITFFNSSIDKHQKYLFLEKEYYDFTNMRDNKLVYIYDKEKFHIYLDHLETNKENTTIIVDKSNAFLEVDDFTFQNRDNINIIGKENSLIIIYLKTTSEINSFQNTNINFYNINVIFINENTFDAFKNNKNNFQFNECNIIPKDYQVLDMDYDETDFNGNYIIFDGNDNDNLFNNNNITKICVLLKDSSNNLLDYKYDNYNNDYNNLFNIFTNNPNNKIEIILNDQQVYSYYDSNIYEIDNKFSIDFFDGEYNKKEMINIDINGQGINNIYNWIYNLKDYERLGNGNYYNGGNYFFYNQYITFKVKYINNHIIKSVFSDNEGFSDVLNIIFDSDYSDNMIYKIDKLNPINRIQTNLILFNDMFGYFKENTLDKNITLYKYMLNGKNKELIKIIRSYIHDKDDLFNNKDKIPLFKFEQTLQIIYVDNNNNEISKEIDIKMDNNYYNFYHDYHINILYDDVFDHYINTENKYKDSDYVKSILNKNISMTNIYEYIKQYNCKQIKIKLFDIDGNLLFENNIHINLFIDNEYSKYVLYNKNIDIMKNSEMKLYYDSNLNYKDLYMYSNIEKYTNIPILNLKYANYNNYNEINIHNKEKNRIINSTVDQIFKINKLDITDLEEPGILFDINEMNMYQSYININNSIAHIKNKNKYPSNNYTLNINNLNISSYNKIITYLILYKINYMYVEYKTQYFNHIHTDYIENKFKYDKLNKTIIHLKQFNGNQIHTNQITKNIFYYAKPTIEYINKIKIQSKYFNLIKNKEQFKDNIYLNVPKFNLFDKSIIQINNINKYKNIGKFSYLGYIKQYKPRKYIINIDKYINSGVFSYLGYIRNFINTPQFINKDKIKDTGIYTFNKYIRQYSPTIFINNKQKYIDKSIYELDNIATLIHCKEIKYKFYKAENLSLNKQHFLLNNIANEFKNIEKINNNPNINLIDTNLLNYNIIYNFVPLWNIPYMSLKISPIILKRDDGDYLCVFINSDEQNYIYTLKIPIYELYDLENDEFPLRLSIKLESDNQVKIYGIKIEDLSKLGEDLLFDNQTTSNESIYPGDYLSYI
jgi:hypothetical protein